VVSNNLSDVKDLVIPVSLLRSTSLTIFEAIVVHLHDTQDFSYHEIGELLARDERNIWTVHHRALKKLKKKDGGHCD
jgi:hypothetical protein